MDQSTGQVVQKMIERPTDAWMAALPILFIVMVLGVLFFCYKLWSKSAQDSTVREERLTTLLDTTLKDHGTTISRQTEALINVNGSLLQLNSSLCNVETRIELVENHIGIGGTK